ncbi:MAG: peptidylprolyl isomerase [Gammaproteobacteria bacterium]|nr:peptidylprolyl isomerase [Gammaproteobacteria bacterium]
MKKQVLTITLCVLMSASYAQQSISDLSFGPREESRGRQLDDIVAIAGTDVITRREVNSFPKKSRKQALQRLIMQKLLLQAAKRYNISVSDTALNIALNQRKNGKSNKSRFSRETLRNDLIIRNLQQQVANSLVQISDAEVANIVDKQLRKSNDKIRLVDVLISVPKSTDTTAINLAQETKREVVEKLGTQSGKQVASQYSNVSYNDLGWVELAQIPALFSRVLLDTPINQYTHPIVDQDGIHILKVLDRKSSIKQGSIPQARVSHILIKDENNPQAKSQINKIYKQLQKGAKFSQLATQYSQDPGSASNGGSLSWVSPGQMVPAFDAMIRRTKTGKMSRPFKSTFGYHILKVEERKKLPINSRQLLERQARQAIFQQRASQEWELWVSRLREESHIEIRDPNL